MLLNSLYETFIILIPKLEQRLYKKEKFRWTSLMNLEILNNILAKRNTAMHKNNYILD